MDWIVQYFAEIPSSHRTLILVGGLTVFWLIESAIPLFRFSYKKFSYKKWRHAGVNIFFTLTTILVNFFLAFILVKSADWVVAEQFGIMQWLSWPLWLQATAGLMLMDLIGAYAPHWTEHRVPLLWRFHVVHHTDQSVDTTTANRHHPGESVIRFAFTTAAVLLLGAPIWLIFLYQSLSALLSQFNHANVKVPSWLDKSLGWLIVMPDMHRVHHHYKLPYTDSNFSNIFSFWDRVFGTYLEAKNENLVYGVDTWMDEKEHTDIWTMLKIPFQPRRKPGGVEDKVL